MIFLGTDRRKEVDGKDYFGMDIYSFKNSSPRQLVGSAYWIEDSLFRNLIEAILRLLERAGFRIVVAHGHGPSTKAFRSWGKELSQKFGMKLLTVWRKDESDGMGIQTDHAAANETSLLMTLHPELVQMENLSKDQDLWPVGVLGNDPRVHASEELGRKAIESQVERVAGILRRTLEKM